MSKSIEELSNLLAFRDGEPVAADLELDAEALAAVTDLKSQLQGMADVPVSTQVWQQEKPTPKWHRYPLSTAASILLLSAAIVFAVGNGAGQFFTQERVSIAENAMPSQINSQLVALMNRSQDLERIAYDSSAWQQPQTTNTSSSLAVSPLGEFILYQLAEVDEAIADDLLGEEIKAQLWQQRVNLLQAFLAEMANQNPGKFENNRSM